MKINKTHILAITAAMIGAAIVILIRYAGNGFEIVPEHQGKLKLFILAGQSNMSGKGGIPAAAKATHPNIYAFGNDYQWKLAVEPVDSPVGQVDKVSEDKGVGFGPSVAFATALLRERPDMIIGLIPCARGGTMLQDWQRNLSVDSLYGSCLKRARSAAPMGEIAGLLFFQGEADAVFPEISRRWGSEFAVFVGSWRSDLNQPGLPVVFAQIGRNTVPEYAEGWEIVKEQQRAVQLPFCKMITTDDLAQKDDEAHFTTKSYQIIGERFAKAYLEIITGH